MPMPRPISRHRARSEELARASVGYQASGTDTSRLSESATTSRPRSKRRPAARTSPAATLRFLPLPVLMPTPPYRLAMFEQDCTLPPNLGRGESVLLLALGRRQVPTAEAAA